MQSAGDRTLKRVAAAYRRQGYRVVAPATPDSLPVFLRDCHPDLIAEREDDHVVVEIKAAGSLKGANDLVDLAERVENQPGWRLELITFKAEDTDAAVISEAWLDRMLAGIQSAPLTVDRRFVCSYLHEVLTFLLRGIALRVGRRLRNANAPEIARALAFEGMIDDALLARIEQAFRWQAGLMRDHAPSPPSEVQAAALETVCRDLLAQAQTPED